MPSIYISVFKEFKTVKNENTINTVQNRSFFCTNTNIIVNFTNRLCTRLRKIE